MLKAQYVFLALALMNTLWGCNGKSGARKSDSGEVIEKTYEKTGSVERYSDKLDDIIPPGELPEIIAGGFDWSEGPLWLPEQKLLIFSDIPENTVYQWSEKDSLKLYLKPSGYTDTIPRGGESGSNGLLLDNQGRLVLCQHGDRRMARMDAPLDDPKPRFITLADNWQGKRLNSPNDAVFNSHGDLFFTDPPYGLEQRWEDPKKELEFQGVYKLSAEGELSLLTDQLPAPNGIGLSPDERKLYVTNAGRGIPPVWMEYEFNEDGTLTKGRVFCDASEKSQEERGGLDGLVVREDGIIFATGPGGVWILAPNGEHLGTVKTGQATSNCTLDDKNRYLYMTADMYLMRIRLK